MSVANGDGIVGFEKPHNNFFVLSLPALITSLISLFALVSIKNFPLKMKILSLSEYLLYDNDLMAVPRQR